MNHDLARAIVLKTGFHPDLMRRAQAALIFIALENREWFVADWLPAELLPPGDTTTAGVAVASLRTLNIIERVQWSDPSAKIASGRRRSENKTRNGAWTNVWRLRSESLARTWLERNGFEKPALKPAPNFQQEFLLTETR